MAKNKGVVIRCLIVTHLAIEFIIESATSRISLISADLMSLGFHLIGFLELDMTGGSSVENLNDS